MAPSTDDFTASLELEIDVELPSRPRDEEVSLVELDPSELRAVTGTFTSLPSSVLQRITGTFTSLPSSVLSPATQTLTSPFQAEECTREFQRDELQKETVTQLQAVKPDALRPPAPRPSAPPSRRALPPIAALPAIPPAPRLPDVPSPPRASSLPPPPAWFSQPPKSGALPPIPTLPRESPSRVLSAPLSLPPIPAALPERSAPTSFPTPLPPIPSAPPRAMESAPRALDLARPRTAENAPLRERFVDTEPPGLAPRAVAREAFPELARRRTDVATRVDVRPPRSEPPLSEPPRAPSVKPVAWSLPPRGPQRILARPIARATGAGMLVGAALFTAAWLLATPSGAAATAQGVVTVTDARGSAVRAVHVYLDGLLRCETAPCVLETDAGVHQIDVKSLVGEQSTSRSVALAKGERAQLHFALAETPAPVVERPAAPLRPAAAPAPAPMPDTPIAVSALPREVETGSPAPTAPAAPASPAPQAASHAVGGAFLNLNSIPISNVVLDGRPVGSTPLMGLSVKPGTHTVTFVHPELGRKTSVVTTEAGQRQAVFARFSKGDSAE